MDLRAALFLSVRPVLLWTGGQGAKLRHIIQGSYQGVWLGILDRHSAQAITAEYYGRQRLKTDRDPTEYLGEEWNLGEVFPWESYAFGHAFGSCSTVLVAGSGAGREAFALIRAGKEVVAFDCTPELVQLGERIANERGHRVKFFHAPPDFVPELGVFDGAIVGWAVYGHIMGRATRLQFLESLRAQIRSGGPLLVSALSHERVSLSGRWAVSLANALRRLRKESQRAEVGDEIHAVYYHRFTKDELVEELSAAGFTVSYVDASGYLNAVALA